MEHKRYLFPMFFITAIVLLMQAHASLYASPEMVALMEYRFDKVQHFGAGGSCGILGCYISTFFAGTQSNRRMIFPALL